MTTKSWIGVGLTVMVFVLFALFLAKGHEVTAVAGLTFGGALLFCGMLIDPAEFKDVLNALRGKTPPVSEYPPLPGSNDATHPNTYPPEGK